jgi:hypothetical protein
MKKKTILPNKKSISVYISYLTLKLILKIIGYRKFDYKGVTQIKLFWQKLGEKIESKNRKKRKM